MSAESFAPVTPSEPDDFSCDMGHVPNDPNADRSDRLCSNMFQLAVILMFCKFCKVKIGMSAMNSIHRDVRGCLLLSHVLVASFQILPGKLPRFQRRRGEMQLPIVRPHKGQGARRF